jgi:hypothetical protein
MAEVVNSLFGVTPESLMAQRDEALQTQAMQYAKMDPFQRATAGIYVGANKLGGAIGGMLGAQDPEMAKAAALQGIMKQADTTTPQGWNTLARSLAQQGFGAQAAQAAQQGQAMQLTGAKITAEEALAQQRIREKAAADPFQKLLQSAVGKVEPASLAVYQQSGNPADLVWTEKLNQPEIAKLQAYRSTLPQGSKERAEVDQVIKAAGESKGTKIDLGIGGVLEKFGAQADAKSAGEAWAKAGDVYKNQVALIPKLDAVEKALPNTFTGSFSNAALQLGKAASAAGIPVDSAKLSNTEYLNSVTAQLVRTIARDFPGSQSNAELQQLLASKPSSAQEWDTIVRLLRDVKKEAKTSTKTYERMGAMPKEERYKTDFNTEYGKTFKDFNQKTNRLNELAKKLNSKTISDTEREEATKLQEELR